MKQSGVVPAKSSTHMASPIKVEGSCATNVQEKQSPAFDIEAVLE